MLLLFLLALFAHISTADQTVVQVFIGPLDIPKQLVASVVTANPVETVFAVDCLSKANCALAKPLRVTGGESTAVVTTTSTVNGKAAKPLTVSCDLAGGTSATAAICTGRSAIAGLGNLASTTTLSQSQLIYASVTVTAGQAKLRAASTANVQSSSSSAGAAPEITGAAQLIIGGVVAGVLGAL